LFASIRCNLMAGQKSRKRRAVRRKVGFSRYRYQE